MSKSKKKQSKTGKWPPRPCAYSSCKTSFSPQVENQKYHQDNCRMLAFYLRKVGGPVGETQRAWEEEIRKIVARQEIAA